MVLDGDGCDRENVNEGQMKTRLEAFWRSWGQKMKYVCKYTPVELLAAFDLKAELLNPAADNYEASDQHIHSNMCSYSRSIVEARLRTIVIP